MMLNKKALIAILAVPVMLMSFVLQQEPITVHMIGDSTMSIKSDRARPETGWGEPFAFFFDDDVTVINHAKNGRSTRTFRAEGRWEPVTENLKKGDYVFIQFGHNDEVQTKKSSTKPDEFRANIENYIKETRAKGATPILLTSVARRHFGDDGVLKDTHHEFAEITRAIAADLDVIFIDMDKISRAYVQKMGDRESKLMYMHLAPGEHPNYPEGKTDDTHFTEYGARMMAQLVLAEIKKQEIPLVLRLTAGRYGKK